MSERIYDLNDRGGCATAVITLADKTFRINRVVTGARVLYRRCRGGADERKAGRSAQEGGSFRHAERSGVWEDPHAVA